MTARSFKTLLDARAVEWRDIGGTRDALLTPKTVAAADHVAGLTRHLEPRRPDPFELDSILRRVRQSWLAERRLDQLSRRDFRSIPWILFYPPQSPHEWLAGDEQFLREFSAEARRSGRVGMFARLVGEFLTTYPESHSCFSAIRSECESLASGMPMSSIADRRWKERCTRYGLLTADACDLCADHLISKRASIREWLVENQILDSAFSASLTKQLILRVGRGLESGRVTASDLTWALSWLTETGAVQSPGLRLLVPESLLVPFLSKQPPKEIGEALKSYFCGAYGDPRIRTGPRAAGWSNVPDEQRSVITRMLVSVALQDFFAVLDRTALDHHWRYRRAFWEAYLERDLITDAWVVFGPKAQRVAQSIRKDALESSGRLTGAGGDQSVLLMKIGGAVVAEWSHNGSCHFWRPGRKNAPSLYQVEYRRDDVREGASVAMRHVGSEAYRWQDRFEEWLRRETSSKVPFTAYRLRRE